MNCFPCFTSQKIRKSQSKREHGSPPQENVTAKAPDTKKLRPDDPTQAAESANNIKAKTYTFRELATATRNFRQECLMGEGGFGRVYKGTIPTTGQVVAVKQLDRNGMQGKEEFLADVLALSQLHHENMVNLIGYCADGDQRLLVYEFMSGGSLEDRLLEKKADQPPLDWYNRMKVAAGVSRGLQFLHDSANPPVVYRDMKATNILLDNDLNAKLSGLVKLSGGGGDNKMSPVPPRVMGTYGYSSPEYERTGQVTFKSDVYSFGVVLLELITGRRAIDTTRPHAEQNLVSWAQPIFKDRKRYPDMADPILKKHFPEKDLNQAVAIAAMCLQDEPEARPFMSDVVTALSFLSIVPPPEAPASLPPATSVSKESAPSESENESESESEGESEGGSGSGSRSESESGSNQGSQIYKSSRRSRNVTNSSSDSEDGSVYSSSNKGSRKLHGKSSRKSCVSQKKSKKSSVRILSHKTSEGMGGNASLSRNSSSGASEYGSITQGTMSFGVNSSRRIEEESMHSGSESDEGSVHSR